MVVCIVQSTSSVIQEIIKALMHEALLCDLQQVAFVKKISKQKENAIIVQNLCLSTHPSWNFEQTLHIKLWNAHRLCGWVHLTKDCWKFLVHSKTPRLVCSVLNFDGILFPHSKKYR